MSTIGTLGKIAGVIAFPVVFGGCCGGGGLLFLSSGTMAAIGTWLGGGGLVAAVIVALSALYLCRKIIRSRKKCETAIELDT
jgi:hypothetical protein